MAFTPPQAPAVKAGTREIFMSQALQEALVEEMTRDGSVFLMGEEIGVWGGAYNVTAGLLERFGPARVIDTPISEAAIAGTAIGAALTGSRPVAEFMYSDFMGIAMDQIVNQAAKNRYMFGGKAKLPIVYRSTFGAGTGNAAQHTQSLEAWFTHVPGLKVVTNSSPYDAKGLLKSAIRDDNVVVFLEHKAIYSMRGPVPAGEYLIPLGVAEVKRVGTDVSVITYARQVHYALEAAEQLAAEGIMVEVVDVRTLYPLDVGTVVQSVKKTNHAVVVHEAVTFGGFGGELAAQIQEHCFDDLDAPVLRVGALHSPVPFSEPLERGQFPDPPRIVAAVRQVLQGSR
ncbi:MAG: alpha-ketoacid dehydrogenase subunit beta [Actinobacteria bacterium]|nr:alpha-ketoacid dehydrogenase subunit beta [Actinomycetota bacterium]